MFLLLVFMVGCNAPSGKGAAPEIPGMVYIKAGEFIRGSDPDQEPKFPESFGFDKPVYLSETPKSKVFLPGFYIDRYEVTVGDYARFLKATGRRKPKNWDRLDLTAWKNYPVVNVSWKDAAAYAEWAGKRLPEESEWEKAARGPDGLRYPWGNDFIKGKANISRNGLLPAGAVKGDVSPYGVHDMGGNVSEWTASEFTAYPDSGYDDPDYGKKYRVYRGGSWGGSGHYYLTYFSRGAFRGPARATAFTREIGFRCAKSAP